MIRTIPQPYATWCNQAFLLLVLLNFIDYITTAQLIAQFGVGVEANPVMKLIIVKYGNAGMMMYKMLAIFTFWLVYKISKSPAIVPGLVMLCCVYGLLAIHNITLCILAL